MGKFALLIGVGTYRSTGFANLAAAVPDVMAIQTVLQDSAVGGFAIADVMTLLNPEPQQMREALERLFSERKPDDLLVLYFSGHGVVDDGGRFHLTTAQTDQGLLNSTAIAGSFIHGLMESSRSKSQVVILDCCFSGAFAKGMMAKGDAVNFQAQLGGTGRAVLTSSSATEYSFEQKEADLSVYTQYVVEGLRTGIADKGGDGWISVDELHEFARAKVRETSPAMQPKIYAVEEGYKIILAKAPLGNPELKYRKEVEQWAVKRHGKLSPTILKALDEKQRQWGLASASALAIRQEVLRPYEEFTAKLQQYEQVLQQELQSGNQLNVEAWEDLKYFQQTLGLTDENIQPLVSSIEISPLVMTAPQIQEPVEQSIETSELLPEASKLLQAPKLEPDDAHAYHNRGSARSNLGDNKGAIADYDQAIKLKPDDADAYHNRGIARFNLGDKKGAIADFDQAIKLKPDYANAYFGRGVVRFNLGDNKGAIADYDQAIKLKPDYANAYFGRGAVHFKLGDNKGAIADFDQNIKLRPDYAYAYYGRGSARSDLGDYRGSIADYDKAIKLKPDYPGAYCNRGNAHRDLGGRKAAIADYTQAIKLKPDYADAYCNRGDVRSDLRDYRGSIADYQKAVELYPTDNPLRQSALDSIKKLQP